jgi:dTDP-4-dehydrorhamnose 3,5-epimerase
MKVIHTGLHGVLILEPVVHEDVRGFFMESYNERLFAENGIRVHFVQDNHSMSVEAGTLRGLHYQLHPKAQTKLVRVLQGAIYDVVLDLRRDSPTYGRWEGYTLSAENKRQLLVPKGFAHGFCTLTPHTHVLYKVDEYYSPEHDRGILWSDPELAIHWPCKQPILSAKDQKHPLFREAEFDF